MPYDTRRRKGKVQIVKEGGKVVGTSTSQEKAESSIRARLAGEHGWKPTGKRRKPSRRKR